MHIAFHILRHSFSIPRLSYTLRTAPCDENPLLLKYDEIVETTLESMFNIRLTELSKIQFPLPVKKAGLGIRKSADIALPAYLSSVEATYDSAKDIVATYTKSANYLMYIDKWKLLTNSDIPENSHMQSSWDVPLTIKKFDSLLQHSPSCQPRLQSLSLNYASDWLSAAPCSKVGTLLNNEEIRSSVCFRLGINLYSAHPCKCGEVCDEKGVHSFSCSRNNGRIIRHDMLNQVISQALTSVGLTNIKEPSNLHPNLRPDGITVLPFIRGKSLIWDVTSPHPLANSRLANFLPNKTSNEAERLKTQKYAPLSKDYHFVPIAIETLGGYGKEATKLITDIGRRLFLKTGDNRSTHFLSQRISIAIQKGNYRTLYFSLI